LNAVGLNHQFGLGVRHVPRFEDMVEQLVELQATANKNQQEICRRPDDQLEIGDDIAANIRQEEEERTGGLATYHCETLDSQISSPRSL